MFSLSVLSFLRRFAIACVVVAMVTTVGVVAGNAYQHHEFEKSPKIHLPDGVLAPARQGQPANYLLIGSDVRPADETKQEAQAYGSNRDTGGARSDVMMVLHVEPGSHTGMLVSFPRDLVVEIPGHGQQLLNAAYGYGGPALAIRTIEQNFSPLKINHYLEVDFRAFKSIVNAIGHVDLYFPTPVNDEYTGLHVAQGGCMSLNGDQALAYARSRHYSIPKDVHNPAPWTPHFNQSTKEWIDPSGWFEDPLADLDRIPRQQYFLRTISQAALNRTGSNPLKINGLLEAIFKNLAHDDTLHEDELDALALTFRGLNPTKVDMLTLPVVGIYHGKWSGHVEVQNPEAASVVARLADFPPPQVPAPPPAEKVRVRVVNGSGTKGAAATALDQFTAAGFVAAGPPEDADRSDYETQVRYAPGKFLEGITAALAAGTTKLVPAASKKVTLGADALVIVGQDYAQLKHGFAAVRHVPGSRATPTTTAGSPTSALAPASTTTTTTTTVPKQSVDTRFVPVDPKSGGPLVGCPKQ